MVRMVFWDGVLRRRTGDWIRVIRVVEISLGRGLYCFDGFAGFGFVEFGFRVFFLFYFV